MHRIHGNIPPHVAYAQDEERTSPQREGSGNTAHDGTNNSAPVAPGRRNANRDSTSVPVCARVVFRTTNTLMLFLPMNINNRLLLLSQDTIILPSLLAFVRPSSRRLTVTSTCLHDILTYMTYFVRPAPPCEDAHSVSRRCTLSRSIKKGIVREALCQSTYGRRLPSRATVVVRVFVSEAS